MMLFIVDMGGVLAQSFDIVPEAARRLALPLDAMRALVAKDMSALLCGSIGADEYWRRFSAASGVGVAEDFWSTLFAPVMDTEVEGILMGLKAHGRVVCGTNTIASHYAYLLETGAYRCFDHVYASQLMGICKPDPDFWRAIVAAEEVDPHDALFIDDMEENVRAASSLGMAAHRFRDASTLRTALAEVLRPAGTPV